VWLQLSIEAYDLAGQNFLLGAPPSVAPTGGQVGKKGRKVAMVANMGSRVSLSLMLVVPDI